MLSSSTTTSAPAWDREALEVVEGETVAAHLGAADADLREHVAPAAERLEREADALEVTSFVTSAGIVTLLLGALVLLGCAREPSRGFAGVPTVVAVVVLMIISDYGIGTGLWVALLGGVLPIVAGLPARPRNEPGDVPTGACIALGSRGSVAS